MVRLNLLLLAVLVALRAVARHVAAPGAQALRRARARASEGARAYETEFGQLQLEQSTWAMPVRVEKIAREQLRDAASRAAPRRGRSAQAARDDRRAPQR